MASLNISGRGLTLRAPALTPSTIETISDLKARADLVDIVGQHTELKRRGRDWWGRCPLHGESTPSFKVNPQRQAFHCFGCGAKGDVVDFLGELEGLGVADACKRLRELVGGAAADPLATARRAARLAASAERERQEAARKKARALAIWHEAEPLTANSPELPVRYLTERRGIHTWPEHALRWHSACPWGTGSAGCIIAPVHDAQGELTAIWRIRPALEGKVDRRGLGPMAGCCCRLVEARSGEPLAIAEGVEDALAVWLMIGLPAWAALSAGNLAALELPSERRAMLIFADADDTGREAALELADRLRAEGREAQVLKPTVGKDPNDVLLARRAPS